MRIPLIVGNWKMNTTLKEAVEIASKLRRPSNLFPSVETVICPPFIFIAAVRDELAGSPIKVGAQNMYFKDSGPFTGEVSPLMLKGLCEYVILGHSERRQYFAEDSQMLSNKVKAAMKHNLKPILCVGENLEQYEERKTQTVVKEQFDAALEGVIQGNTLTIAYEPVWAIGTGRAATGKQAQETVAFIRKLISDKFGMVTAVNARILYGGSVTPGNIAEFIEQPDIDGALVGGASLKVDEFTAIVKSTAEIRGNS